ncbi:thymic stromal cotransporter homolog isoform X2 [Pristis pectinata]|uniref:thymic stromal cotransporter homolog isoform X2 n=1 Tax=Pristis pectinata TaxID=685728 RepID=UPI00223C95A0|nr:thymic stromal cotransporter homolog isoform X2 [Pristis pectinata]
MCGKLPSFVEIVVALHQVAGAFFDTGLLMIAQQRCNTTAAGSKQKCISQFYMYNNLLLGITPLLFTFTLAKLGDQKSRKITIGVPLLGYLISRSLLLCVTLFHLALEVILCTALVNGLSGGFTSFWTGVMALASDTSPAEDRSVRFIRIELTYGLAGLIGSIASGHIFVHFTLSHYQGAVLAGCSCALYMLSFLYCILGLKVPSRQTQTASAGSEQVGSKTPLESDRLLDQARRGHVSETAAAVEVKQQNTITKGSPTEASGLLDRTARAQDEPGGCTPVNITVILLFTGGVLYDLSVTGGVDVIPMFVLKEPLNWNAVWVGYGNAAGYTIFLTSYLGVKVLSRYLKDTSLIVIGIVSFSTGMLIMAFVKWTYLFFIGKVFGVLQILLTLTGVIASTIFVQIYISTKDWYPSLCFSLSSIISCLSIIPIILVERRLSEPSRYSRIPED